MKNKELIKAFKNAEVDFLKNNPVKVNKEMMSNVHGGASSAGHICTISGECNTSGNSCGDSIRGAVKSILDALW